ncbi:hypothetical protein 268TH004_78 [Bacillus phage 268TH004]|uniref:Uncharacterized protein n=1 Tax=Bacillus phage 268TH004 TaxID=2801523 RepID=A0A7T7ZAQ4_9CAUD|nr:hypothetical protein 276BB001_76 [Bacillus phage 276BB001]QFG05995.1 hypothetical protein 280BB001_76 [Bacillus phage 280BB001]QQO40423.1 hypothetical protein 268TH004_78 [Bacillus phage 268TH004]QZA70144.1 hypothetical protein 274BB002_76 [Bacillus phage 274BB002]
MSKRVNDLYREIWDTEFQLGQKKDEFNKKVSELNRQLVYDASCRLEAYAKEGKLGNFEATVIINDMLSKMK